MDAHNTLCYEFCDWLFSWRNMLKHLKLGSDLGSFHDCGTSGSWLPFSRLPIGCHAARLIWADISWCLDTHPAGKSGTWWRHLRWCSEGDGAPQVLKDLEGMDKCHQGMSANVHFRHILDITWWYSPHFHGHFDRPNMIMNQIESLEWRVTGNPLATVTIDSWSAGVVPAVGGTVLHRWQLLLGYCKVPFSAWKVAWDGKVVSKAVKNLSSLRYVEMNKSDFMRKAGFSTSTQRA